MDQFFFKSKTQKKSSAPRAPGMIMGMVGPKSQPKQETKSKGEVNKKSHAKSRPNSGNKLKGLLVKSD